MAKRGHEVSGVTFTRQYPKLLFPGSSQLVPDSKAPDVRPVRLLDTLNPLSWRRTANHILDEKPDVVLFSYWTSFFAPAFGSVARRLKREGVRVIALVHNALPHERRPGDRTLGKYFLRMCDGLIVLSDRVRQDVESLGARAEIRQVPHPAYDVFGTGIPKEEARELLGIEVDRPVLLFFGFIRTYKGLHVLLEAMKSVSERLPDALLLVAGEFYQDEERLRSLAKPLGNAVRFDDRYIERQHVAHYFSAADVVVQPYVSATQSGVAQIAFHFERSIVTTDVGGLGEIVPNEVAGLVVPPENPAALSDAIVRFFEENLAGQLEAGVRRERERYSWDHVCDAIEALAQQGENATD